MAETASTHAKDLLIRLAMPGDAEGIRQVYAPYIDTPITFEEEVSAPAEYRARMEEVMGFYPCLVVCEQTAGGSAHSGRGAEGRKGGGSDKRVAEKRSGADLAQAGRVVGFAYAHRQAERAAYDWNAELSIYLEQDAVRSGTGSTLYAALLELLPLQGVRCCYARVTLPNAASERLHARFGFDTMGIQRNAGFKNGAWRDVAWYVKPVGPFDADPARPIPFPDAAREHATEIERILRQANGALQGGASGR